VAKAVIVGASGLVGNHLLNILLQSAAYKEVAVLVRKELPVQHPKLKQVVIDFEQLLAFGKDINGHALFCCLGSTRKKTPDMAVYQKIDRDYPLQLAQIALKNGIAQYHLVSALGANASASNFYRKMKGEVEADVQQVGLSCLHIYRPSLLTGDRSEKNRTAEKFASALFKLINPLLVGSLKKYRSIPAVTVAQAMYKQSLIKKEGVFIHLSDEIKEIA